MTNPGRRLVGTSEGLVHVWTRKGEGLPLLLLHMSPRSGRMYLPAMGLLERPVAAPDRPGFGYSDVPAGTPTIERYAAATLEVVDSLGWDRFDVIGTHTGAVEAVQVAHLAGDRVTGIGLVAVPAYTPEEVEERKTPGRVAAPRPRPRHDGSHVRTMWNQRTAIRSDSTDPDYLQELFLESMLSASGAHLAYRAVLAYPTLQRLVALDRPVVVFAARDDLTIQTQRAIPHLPPGSVAIELDDLDFDLWKTATARIVDLIQTHLQATRPLNNVRLPNNMEETHGR